MHYILARYLKITSFVPQIELNHKSFVFCSVFSKHFEYKMRTYNSYALYN